ncbi:MAG: para-aminobenzoate synthetase component [Frankiaceae bacterium]|nr:para-aminobenzoate synthetase component [Frankiaceae bacterium]
MITVTEPAAPYAFVGGRLHRDLVELTDDLAALERPGPWVVVGTFEGVWTCARFASVEGAPMPVEIQPWQGPARRDWRSSLDESSYTSAVRHIRDRIAAGDVYQVNLCRVLDAPSAAPDLTGLLSALSRGNPAPYLGAVRVPGLDVVTASPELFLRRLNHTLTSSPIKGTGRTAADITDKDYAENVMIVDLVRHDVSPLAVIGGVDVPELCVLQQHPGLVHLVSTVRAQLRNAVSWAEIIDATMPPGSVSGAPKQAALRIINELEPVPRGPYCGAIGWVDGDRGELAVGIRTFWLEGGRLMFGTGAGITWGSDPQREWAETELKGERLLAIASAEGWRP